VWNTDRCEDELYSATTLVLKGTGSVDSVPRHELRGTVRLLRDDGFCTRNLFYAYGYILFIGIHALCPNVTRAYGDHSPRPEGRSDVRKTEEESSRM
jgi:hypothetical protein